MGVRDHRRVGLQSTDTGEPEEGGAWPNSVCLANRKQREMKRNPVANQLKSEALRFKCPWFLITVCISYFSIEKKENVKRCLASLEVF